MRLCELREKEVINVCNCKCLGFVADIDIDVCTGMVLALIIPGCGKVWGIFGKESESGTGYHPGRNPRARA